MFAALLLLLTCSPLPSAQDPSHGGAVPVRGEPELTQAEAHASARRKADELVRARLAERAERAVNRAVPFWVPAPFAERTVDRWVDEAGNSSAFAILDQEVQRREHEFGSSFQTTLWIGEEPRQIEQAERRLQQRLRSLERATAVRYGGTVAIWLLLAVTVGWLDRMSRGYMTGRLRAIGLFAGVAIPAVFFLL
jgi:hypothetical protein